MDRIRPKKERAEVFQSLTTSISLTTKNANKRQHKSASKRILMVEISLLYLLNFVIYIYLDVKKLYSSNR